MKKKLLLVVLALAILTSLTAGTLAVYTRTLSDSETVAAKRFAFSLAGQLEGENTSINLAPSESMKYNFVISNADSEGDPRAEVALAYKVTINYAQAATDMPGLTATLKDKSGKTVGDYSTAGQITYTTQSAANAEFDEPYSVTLEWVDDGSNNSGQTTAGSSRVTLTSGLSVSVNATQVVAKD